MLLSQLLQESCSTLSMLHSQLVKTTLNMWINLQMVAMREKTVLAPCHWSLATGASPGICSLVADSSVAHSIRCTQPEGQRRWEFLTPVCLTRWCPEYPLGNSDIINILFGRSSSQPHHSFATLLSSPVLHVEVLFAVGAHGEERQCDRPWKDSAVLKLQLSRG